MGSTDGTSVGIDEGVLVGLLVIVGKFVGLTEGDVEGRSVGVSDGLGDGAGLSVGSPVGGGVGPFVPVGVSVGISDGDGDGAGLSVGSSDGTAEGPGLGAGLSVGSGVATTTPGRATSEYASVTIELSAWSDLREPEFSFALVLIEDSVSPSELGIRSQRRRRTAVLRMMVIYLNPYWKGRALLYSVGATEGCSGQKLI